MERDFVKELKIDKMSLDEEWEEQSIKFLKAAMKAIDAQSNRDLAMVRLDTVRAEVEDTIRKDPNGHGIDKITESAVKGQVVLSEEVQKAERDYLDMVTDAKVLDAMVKALDQRKRSLENLTQLFLAGYYAKPYVPEKARELSLEARHEEQVKGLERSPRLKRKL